MDNKKLVKYFSGFVLVVFVATLLASIFYNHAFVPSAILMLALFVFSVCYYIKDEKKNLMYGLFVLGVLLIIASLIYTYLSLRLI